MKKADIEIDKQASPAEPEPLVNLESNTVTPEQFEELKERAAKAEENWDRLLRTTADFDNFKKRTAQENDRRAAIHDRHPFGHCHDSSQLTPSFFCRFEDEVVYWNTRRLSGKT